MWDPGFGKATAGTSGGGAWNASTSITDWVTTAGADTYWVNGSSGVFAGPTAGATGAYAVTLGSPLTAFTLAFNTSGYNLSAGTTQTLALTQAGTVVTLATGVTTDIGGNVIVNFSTNSNTGERTVLNPGAVLNIEAGAVYTRTGGDSGYTSTGGSFGFTGGTTASPSTINVAGTLSYNNSSPGPYGGLVFSNAASDNETVNVNAGGLVGSDSLTTGIVVANGAGSATTVLNVNTGGTVSTTGTGGVNAGINLANNATDVATVNLNGGTISTYEVNQNFGTVTGGTGTFNFNGGSIVAIANNTAFMTGLTAANVLNGGATFNSST